MLAFTQLAFLLLLAGGVCAQTGPSPEETETLWWLNRFRADPRAFGQSILARPKPESAAAVDWELFASEIAILESAPPVFFETRLTAAARAHARYMLEAKEYGHHETVGLPGFTGETPIDRAKAAGYPTTVEECTFFRGGRGQAAIANYVIDAGPVGVGSGGMQAGRGHRACLIKRDWREGGIGVVPWGHGQYANVLLFGKATGIGRILGGVAFQDSDGDREYDAGEGLGGVHVVVGGFSALSSESGAWRIDLPVKVAAEVLQARWGPLELSVAMGKGQTDAAFDLVFDAKSRVEELKARIAAMPAEPSAPRLAPFLDLLRLRPAETEEERAMQSLIQLKLLGLEATMDGQGPTPPPAGQQTGLEGCCAQDWPRQAYAADLLMHEAKKALAVKDAATRAKRVHQLREQIDREMARSSWSVAWNKLSELRETIAASAR